MEKSNGNAILWGLIERIGIIIVLAGVLTLVIPSLLGAQSNYTLLAGAGILILGAIAHIIVTMCAIDKDNTYTTVAEVAEEPTAATTEEKVETVEAVAEEEKAIKVEK